MNHFGLALFATDIRTTKRMQSITVRYYRMGLNNVKRTGDIWLMATHEGDNKYKSSVQQINIRIPHRNTEGMKQTITFNKIDYKKQKFIALKASSDCGLPVNFYIKDGPAEIRNDRLFVTKIPPRSKYPVKVTVVAWQYGLTSEPKVRTAEQVERFFYINN